MSNIPYKCIDIMKINVATTYNRNKLNNFPPGTSFDTCAKVPEFCSKGKKIATRLEQNSGTSFQLCDLKETKSQISVVKYLIQDLVRFIGGDRRPTCTSAGRFEALSLLQH